jgi:signal transduction histidine kinase
MVMIFLAVALAIVAVVWFRQRSDFSRPASVDMLFAELAQRTGDAAMTPDRWAHFVSHRLFAHLRPAYVQTYLAGERDMALQCVLRKPGNFSPLPGAPPPIPPGQSMVLRDYQWAFGLRNGRQMGSTIVLGWSAPQVPPPKSTLHALASVLQAGLCSASHHARQFEQQAISYQLTEFIRLANGTTHGRRLDVTLARILKRLVGFDDIVIFATDPGSGNLVLRYATPQLLVQLPAQDVLAAAEALRPDYPGDLADWLLSRSGQWRAEWVDWLTGRSGMVIPLIRNEGCAGLIVGLKSGDIRPADVGYLRTIQKEAAAAFHRLYTQQSLKATISQLQHQLYRLPVGILRLTPRYDIVFANEIAVRFLGLSTLSEAYTPLEPSFAACPDLRQILGLMPGSEPLRFETTVQVGQDSQAIIVEAHYIQPHLALEPYIMICLQDNTMVDTLKSQVVQLNQLSTLGMMSAGIAHEIKNPLVAIKAFAQMLTNQWNEQKFREKFSQIVIHQVDRIDELCQAMLRGGRPNSKKELIAAQSVLKDVFSLLEGERKHYSATAEMNIDEAGLMFANYNQMIQVFLNLGMNALHALPKSNGEIRVEVGDAHGYVTVSIADNGCGMSAAEQANLFKPFYTTKKSGTGLGLSVVAQIIRDHRGALHVQSESGQGTVFTVFIPGESPQPALLKASYPTLTW